VKALQQARAPREELVRRAVVELTPRRPFAAIAARIAALVRVPRPTPPTVARVHQAKWDADRRARQIARMAVDPTEIAWIEN
jgi:hypothetical protein